MNDNYSPEIKDRPLLEDGWFLTFLNNMTQSALLLAIFGMVVCGEAHANEYAKPFAGMESRNVGVVEIKVVYDDNGDVSKETLTVDDAAWIATLFDTVTDKDYPVFPKEKGAFSLPCALCHVRCLDESGKELLRTSIFGAWNLMMTKRAGKRGVLGSNRAFAALIIKKLNAEYPEVIKSHRQRYAGQFSGVFEHEYHEMGNELSH